MKLTLNKIVTIDEEINILLTKDLKAKFSFKLSKFKLKTFELANLAKSKKDELIKKYGEIEGDNIVVRQNSKNWSKWAEEVNELFSTEEELPDFSISIDDLEGIELSPKFFLNMGELITE